MDLFCSSQGLTIALLRALIATPWPSWRGWESQSVYTWRKVFQAKRMTFSLFQAPRKSGPWGLRKWEHEKENGDLSLSHVLPTLARLPHYMRAWNRLDDPSIEKGWPGLASHLAEPTFCFTYGSPCFVTKSRQGWLAQGNSVTRVTLLPRTRVLHMNEALLVKGAEIAEL